MANPQRERVQINASIPAHLKRRLKVKLAGAGVTYSDWLEAQIQNYVAPKQREAAKGEQS